MVGFGGSSWFQIQAAPSPMRMLAGVVRSPCRVPVATCIADLFHAREHLQRFGPAARLEMILIADRPGVGAAGWNPVGGGRR
jgi:hypothetical protein